jgi:hypothetical protein
MDLRPYVCLFEYCAADQQLFASWKAMRSHVALEHGKHSVIPATDLPDDPESITCPLCLRPSSSPRSAARHLRQHMEELALFALPPSYRGADDEDADRGNANDGADSGEAFSRSDETSFPIFSVSGSTANYRESPVPSVSGSTSSDHGELAMPDAVLRDFAARYVHTQSVT